MNDQEVKMEAREESPVGVTAVSARGVVFEHSTRNMKGKLEKVVALDKATMTVPMGVIYGLLGPSGCGKTTLLRCLVGSLSPKEGEVSIFGYKPGDIMSGVPGPGIGFMPQDIALNDNLTIDEMLTYFGRLCFMGGKPLEETIDHLVKILDLPEKHQSIGTLSGGQKRRVSFAATLVHKPRLIILDEPTVGVDPMLREVIWHHLIELTQREKVTVIITTHYIEEARRANIVGFMRKGHILTEDNPEALMQKMGAKGLEEVFAGLCTQNKKDRHASTGDGHTPDTEMKIVTKDPLPLTNGRKLPFKRALNMSPSTRWCRQFITLFIKFMIQWTRQPETIFAQFLLPLANIVLVAICLGGLPSMVPMGVVNQEVDPYYSSLFLNKISKYIVDQVNYTDFDEAIGDVKSGKLWGVVKISPNFSEMLVDRVLLATDLNKEEIENSNIRIYGDWAKRTVAQIVQNHIEAAFGQFVGEALVDSGRDPREGQFPVKVEAVYEHLDTSDFLGLRSFVLPGFIMFLAFVIGYTVSCFVVIEEIVHQMYERTYTTGITGSQVVFSIFASNAVFSFISNAFLLFVSIAVFDVPCQGSFLLALSALNVVSLAGLVNGVIFGIVFKSHFVSATISNGYVTSIMILSGVIWPIEALPTYLRLPSLMQPLTLPLIALRSIMSRGLGLTHPAVYPGFLVPLPIILFFIFIAIKFVK